MAKTSAKPPTNLLEAVRYFSDLDVANDYFANVRWPNGPVCPRCGGVEPYYISTRRTWTCKACKRGFSVKVGTIFEDSPLGLDKWLPAIWLAANSKNGISSHELARALGTTQKSAWFMLHRIRLAMQTGSFDKLSDEVEADETFVGGKAKFQHKHKRKHIGTGGVGKAAVMGLLERNGHVRAYTIPNTRKATLHPIIEANVEPGSALFTDAAASYSGLNAEYVHEVIDHAEAYVNGRIHTNGLENFWSLLKRGLNGTYISVEPFHLFRYLDERVFTYNMRDLTDLGRFTYVLRQAAGRRLTYAELTAQR